MTPLPPELLELRAELHEAARRRARRRFPPTWLRLPGLTLSAFLALGAVAVAAGLLVPGRDGYGGDGGIVRVVGGPSAGTAWCGPVRGGPALCRDLDRAPGPVSGVHGVARRRRATGIVRTSATLCERGRCRELASPTPAVRPTGPGRSAFQRQATRPSAGPPGSGGGLHRPHGYRSAAPSVSWVAVDGAAARACTARSPDRTCRAWRAVSGARPPVLSRIIGRLGARIVVVETASRCRLGRRYVCRPVFPAAGRRLSAAPQRLEPGESLSYTRLVFRR